jgi:hypothetical protein
MASGRKKYEKGEAKKGKRERKRKKGERKRENGKGRIKAKGGVCSKTLTCCEGEKYHFRTKRRLLVHTLLGVELDFQLLKIITCTVVKA